MCMKLNSEKQNHGCFSDCVYRTFHSFFLLIISVDTEYKNLVLHIPVS